MPENSRIKFTIAFNDPDLDPEERDEQAQWFMAELKQMDEVDAVDRVLDPNPPEGNKGLGGFLAGVLILGAVREFTEKLFMLFLLGGKRLFQPFSPKKS